MHEYIAEILVPILFATRQSLCKPASPGVKHFFSFDIGIYAE